MNGTMKEVVELTKLKTEYAGAKILEKHNLLGQNNSCIKQGLLEVLFDVDGTWYLVDCKNVTPNTEKKQTTYKYVVYEVNPTTQNRLKKANGQITVADPT